MQTYGCPFGVKSAAANRVYGVGITHEAFLRGRAMVHYVSSALARSIRVIWR